MHLRPKSTINPLDYTLFRRWLVTLSMDTSARYFARIGSTSLFMQCGESHRRLLELTGPLDYHEMSNLHLGVINVSTSEEPFARVVDEAWHLSRIQKDHLDAALDLPPHQRPERIFPRTESSSDSLQRWCGWLDAVIHLRAHSLFKLAPELFDPAANKNAATAILTADIPNLPKKAAVNSPAWIWHPGMPRIAAPALLHELSRGVTHDPWPFRQLDTLLILLFPLATHYQWNFAGLADLLRAHLRRSEPYPCWSPRELEAYCTHTLGLHGLSLEGPSNSRQLPGCNLALKICRPPASGLGNPPWS